MRKSFFMQEGRLTELSSRSAKGFSLDEFLRRTGQAGKLTASPGGLAKAYSAGVWAYNCITLRAQTVASVPLLVVDREGDELPGHPLAAVFSDYASGMMWRIEAGLLIWGECYLEVMRDVLVKRARNLQWLNPQVTAPRIPAGKITAFEYMGIDRQVIFPVDDVVYFYYFNPNDDLRGLAPLAVALGSVGADRDTVAYTQAFFANGARLDGIVVIPDASDEQIDAFESKWRKVFRGVGNSFRTLVFGARDASYTPVTVNPDDLALAEVRAETRRDVCAAFRVPPALAGAWEAANYAASAEQRRSFYIETILPELDFIEDQLNRQLTRYWPEARLKFDVKGLEAVIDDEARRNQAVALAVQGGWMTINEARARANLEPVPGGDVFVPMPGTAQMPAGGAEEGGWLPPLPPLLDGVPEVARARARSFRWEEYP